MLLVNTIVEDVKDINACKHIRPFDLKELGYVFSKKKIRITNTSYEIREVLDEMSKRPVSFSFLLSRKQLMGIILPKEFHRYAIISKEELKGTGYEEDSCEKKNPRRNKRPED